MNLRNLVCTFSSISTFSLPHTSHLYNKIGAMQLSNNFSIMSVGRFNRLPFCISKYIAFDALSQSHSHMEYDSIKNYQKKKPKIISRSYYGTPFHHTSSPKLPLKHSAQRKLIHGVGMETVYVCMWQGSDSIHTHNQPITIFR